MIVGDGYGVSSYLEDTAVRYCELVLIYNPNDCHHLSTDLPTQINWTNGVLVSGVCESEFSPRRKWTQVTQGWSTP